MLVANLTFAKDEDGRVEALFQKLEGKWRIVSAEISGQKIESDEEWRFKCGSYKWIDSKREMRGYTRNWDSGIYKLSEDGEALTVCIGKLPSKEFTTTKEDKRRLYVLKRAKERHTENVISTPNRAFGMTSTARGKVKSESKDVADQGGQPERRLSRFRCSKPAAAARLP